MFRKSQYLRLLLKLQRRRNDMAMAALLCCRTIRSGWLEDFTALGAALFSVAIYMHPSSWWWWWKLSLFVFMRNADEEPQP